MLFDLSLFRTARDGRVTCKGKGDKKHVFLCHFIGSIERRITDFLYEAVYHHPKLDYVTE